MANIPSSTTLSCHGVTVKQDGTIYALLDNSSATSAQVVQIVPTNNPPYARVDTGSNAPAYETVSGLSWDFTNQRILVFDQAQSQTNAKIISVNPTNGTRAYVTSGSTSSGAYGGSYLNRPTTGFRNTANRILYTDFDLVSFTKVQLSTVLPGSTVASQYYTGPTATSGNGQFGANASLMAFIPPSQAVITSPTATTGAAGTTATLGANVTSPGTALVTPTIQTRGVVYSLTSTNANPTIGGPGVTPAASSAEVGTYTVSVSA